MSKRVHIIYNPNKNDVVSRLMSSLAEGTGWTISKQLDRRADINYFGLYISVGQNPNVVKQLRPSQVAAWFTHNEVQRKEKQEWWTKAAQVVDIRTTTARQYYDMLSLYGDTHLVFPPPIDPQFFGNPKKPRIGIAGYVHPKGRKGEFLAHQLYEVKNGEWDIVATGNGWGIPNTKLRDWIDLPSFYRSLDVFLCTSLTEGIPMPPLEALACGTPIVIPRGVGILDDLPERSNIERYHAGDFSSMMNALNVILERFLVSNYMIKEVSELFTQENWVKSHKEAFGMGAIKGVSDTITKQAIKTDTRRNIQPQIDIRNETEVFMTIPLRTGDDGSDEYFAENVKFSIYRPKPTPENTLAVCVAYGDPARNCARRLIKSWNAHMPYVIAYVSDSVIELDKESNSLWVNHPDTDIGARSIKTNLYNILSENLPHWVYALYLDSDTEIIADISQLFTWLSRGWDFIICTNPFNHKTLEDGKRPDNQTELQETIELLGNSSVLQPNGGVFAFARNAQTERFMNTWHDEWKSYRGRDQMALLRAMYKVPMRHLLLTNAWNTIIRDGVDLTIEDSAGILHHPMNARRWDGIVYGELDSPMAWDMVSEWEKKNKREK